MPRWLVYVLAITQIVVVVGIVIWSAYNENKRLRK